MAERSASPTGLSAIRRISCLALPEKIRKLRHPRECWEIKKIKDGVRGDYMLISIEPPLPPHP